MKLKTKQSIIKFLTKEANLDELIELELWISNPKNERIFLEFVKANLLANKTLKVYDKKQAKKIIAHHIKHKRYRKRGYKVFKYAAVVILISFLSVSYFFKNEWFVGGKYSKPNLPVGIANNIVPGTNKATLTLDNGAVFLLEEGSTLNIQNAKSNGGQIVYSAEDQNPKKIEYHTVKTPRGGQYYIVLSDSTEIWLNSETLFRYPVEFVNGKPRKVELIYGEAYFHVSSIGSSFHVLNQGQTVEVLGTEFNISAYQNETDIYTTLVKGNVAIGVNGQEQRLQPNEQSKVNASNKSMVVYQVDANAETSWRHGLFTFKGKPLKDIMKVLSRWYDVDIIFMDKKLESIKFKGVLGKNQNIEEILSIMKTNTINNYEIKGKTITLK